MRVVLVRCHHQRARALLERERAAGMDLPRWVFFHGSGVGHGLNADSRAHWEVFRRPGCCQEFVACETALKRRAAGDQEAGWRPGSLMEFWDHAAGAQTVVCYGEGW